MSISILPDSSTATSPQIPSDLDLQPTRLELEDQLYRAMERGQVDLARRLDARLTRLDWLASEYPLALAAGGDR